jgi:probable F420-dependent oxidoreductase
MNFGIAFANAGPFGYPEMLTHLATTAENVGIESLWTVEHVIVPVGYQSEYPYDPSGKMPGPEDSPIPDPILPLAYVAGITKKIRLGTGILILPQRHPTYVAKEIATLDVLSGGRAILGIGVGWLREEFDALGIPFEERAARTRESVEAIRSLWKEGTSTFEGKYFRWPAVESNPKPVQAGGVPIVIGGHTDLAAKRAARYCDGFFPGRGDAKRIGELLTILKDECKKVGRDPSEIELTLPLPLFNYDLDLIRRYRDMGASRVMIGPPGFDKEGLAEGLERFGNDVIAKL